MTELQQDIIDLLKEVLQQPGAHIELCTCGNNGSNPDRHEDACLWLRIRKRAGVAR